MDIPGTSKNQPAIKPELVATSLRGRKFKFSTRLIVWSLFALVMLVEVYSLYQDLYKNLTLSDEASKDISRVSVRINLDNYTTATKRLDQVSSYRTPAAIDFSGNLIGVGRSSPFSDPQ